MAPSHDNEPNHGLAVWTFRDYLELVKIMIIAFNQYEIPSGASIYSIFQ